MNCSAKSIPESDLSIDRPHSPFEEHAGSVPRCAGQDFYLLRHASGVDPSGDFTSAVAEVSQDTDMSNNDQITTNFSEKGPPTWTIKLENKAQKSLKLRINAKLPKGVKTANIDKRKLNLAPFGEAFWSLTLKLSNLEAGHYWASIEVVDEDSRDADKEVIKTEPFDFEVSRKGRLLWKIGEEPAFESGMAVFPISMSSTLNAPVKVELVVTSPAAPIKFEIKPPVIDIKPGAQPDPPAIREVAQLEVSQESFTQSRTKITVALNCKVMMVDIPQPGTTSSSATHTTPLGVNEISPAFPFETTIVWPDPGDPVTFRDLKFDPENSVLTFTLVNNWKSPLEVELSGSVGDQPLTHPPVSLGPSGSEEFDFSSSLPKLAGTYRVSLTATASVATHPPVKKDIPFEVPIRGKLEWSIKDEKPPRDGKVAIFPLSLTNKLNAPVRVSLDNQQTGDRNLRLEPTTTEFIQPGRSLEDVTLRVSQERFQQTKSEIQVALAAEADPGRRQRSRFGQAPTIGSESHLPQVRVEDDRVEVPGQAADGYPHGERGRP